MAVVLLLVSVLPGTSPYELPAGADATTDPPAKPGGLKADTEAGSLDASLDWEDVDGASYYRVRWRAVGTGDKLNEGVEVQSSSASITVAGYGEWVVRVEACNSAGCGSPATKRFEIDAPAETPEPTPEPDPTPTEIRPQRHRSR